MIEKMVLDVKDVQVILGICKCTAYKVINDLNSELEEKGYLVRPGKIPAKYLSEKIYGLEINKEALL